MGAFDDLIPGQSAGAFDDLIPGKAGPTKDAYLQAQFMRGINPLGPLASDAAYGIAEPLMKVAQMVAHIGGNDTAPAKFVDKGVNAAKSAYDSAFQPDSFPGAGLARGGGQGLVTMPLAVAKGGAVLAGAANGGISGLLEPNYGDTSNFWTDTAKQGAKGAAIGSAFGLGAKALGKTLEGATMDPAQQALKDTGVQMTPGQILGGPAKGVEDKLTSLPIIGDLIKKSQFRGITDFNRAIYAKALEPFGNEGAQVAAKADVGNVGIQQVGDFLSAKYEQALPQIKVGIDQEFVQSMGQLGQMAKQLPTDMQQQFSAILKGQLVDRGLQPGQMIGGETMKVADSQLGQLAAAYKGSGNPDQRQLGMALQQAQANLRDMVARQNPEVAPLVEAANQGWSVLAQLERAGSMLGAKDGIFTPSQFLNAIKRGDTSVRDRKFARGEMLNQDFAQSADSVLPNKVPDSGTAGRYILMDALNPANWHGAAAAAVAGLPYMPVIGPALTNLAMLARPQGARDSGAMLQRLAPYLGLLAGSSASQQTP